VLFLNILSKVLFISFLLLGCQDKKEIAFYYWKSRCDVNSSFSYPLYVKVLDIGVKNVIKTVCKKPHISVVYIDNRALKQRDDISKLVLQTVPKDVKEVQFDCDWTLSTKKKYFQLLTKMKKYYKKITVTIRLHQLKYSEKTGVPPVDGGVLMFYNMSDFLDSKTKNYILDLKVAKSYLKDFKTYPLKLDLALPIYSMATIIRYGKVVGVIDGVKKNFLGKNFVHLKENRYKVLKTHYFKGHLLYEGDILRVDEVSLKILKKAVKMIPFEFGKIIYFRYSSLKYWEQKNLLSI